MKERESTDVGRPRCGKARGLDCLRAGPLREPRRKAEMKMLQAEQKLSLSQVVSVLVPGDR